MMVTAPSSFSMNVKTQIVSAVVAQPKLPKGRHSLSPEKVEMFKSLEPWASKYVLPQLKPVEKCWQPSEFLPSTTNTFDSFMEEVRDLKARTWNLPDEYFVVLVGDMITEEALPTYETVFNTFEGVRDETGASSSPWSVWNRAWTAEENRHGDLLRTYIYLSGRVNMPMIEKTIQYLIGSGMDPGTENNPYMGFVYTSFQERATFVSHGNTARLAKEGGDPVLAKICGTIAADEKRHENAYASIVEKLLEVDTNEAMVAIDEMMRKKITMPAYLMYDGQDPNLFEHFSGVAQRLGVYTTHDYVDNLDFFIRTWKLEKISTGLNDEGRRAQEFICGLPARFRKYQERADERAKKLKPRGVKFSWIFDNEVTV